MDLYAFQRNILSHCHDSLHPRGPLIRLFKKRSILKYTKSLRLRSSFAESMDAEKFFMPEKL